jgi:F420-dependent oxidoreductase-like protein
MRFGIKTNPEATTFPALLAMWRRADELEAIESAWVFDHFYPIHSDPNGPCMESWVVLSALAQATERVRIGSMVNGMPYRHPAVTANMAAALDIVSEGRLELGLGAGWNEQEAGAYGISLGASLRERMDMFDEAVEAIVGLLSQEETTLHGEHVVLTNARNEPKGPQRPHPPIVIGGMGERRTLRIAARWADHWNAPTGDPEVFAAKSAVLDRHCADLGRDPSEILRSVMLRFDPDDVDGLADHVVALAAAGAEKAIFILPTPHDPAHVDLVADLASSMA